MKAARAAFVDITRPPRHCDGCPQDRSLGLSYTGFGAVVGVWPIPVIEPIHRLIDVTDDVTGCRAGRTMLRKNRRRAGSTICTGYRCGLQGDGVAKRAASDLTAALASNVVKL